MTSFRLWFLRELPGRRDSGQGPATLAPHKSQGVPVCAVAPAWGGQRTALRPFRKGAFA